MTALHGGGGSCGCGEHGVMERAVESLRRTPETRPINCKELEWLCTLLTQERTPVAEKGLL